MSAVWHDPNINAIGPATKGDIRAGIQGDEPTIREAPVTALNFPALPVGLGGGQFPGEGRGGVGKPP